MGDCESTSIHTAAPSHLLSLKKTEDWGVAQLEECLLSICEALSSIPTTQNLGMVAHACNSRRGRQRQEDQKFMVTFNYTGI